MDDIIRAGLDGVPGVQAEVAELLAAKSRGVTWRNRGELHYENERESTPPGRFTGEFKALPSSRRRTAWQNVNLLHKGERGS
jgi:hypothetical protein